VTISLFFDCIELNEGSGIATYLSEIALLAFLGEVKMVSVLRDLA
jgi:hypothetical protein